MPGISIVTIRKSAKVNISSSEKAKNQLSLNLSCGVGAGGRIGVGDWLLR